MSTARTIVEQEPARRAVYGRAFWWAYLANLLLVTANAITFRFAEFVNFLGGTEEATGSIIRMAVIGSILIRLTVARDLDRYGVRKMWVASSLLFVIGNIILLTSQSIGWQIYLARGVFQIGLACMFTTANVHIMSTAPPARRTEIVGTLGSSGFVGMMLGAQISDAIFTALPRTRSLFMILFGLTTLLGLAYLGIVLWLTRKDVPVHQPDTPPPWTLLRRHWPGPVVLVALAMGVGFVVTTVFLTRYATTLGLTGIRTFFTGYAISAFTFRIMTRTWSRSVGRHRMVMIGLLGHVVGHLSLLTVETEWGFLFPSACCGFGHALLFPCVISLGSESFPERFRGTGTTIILGFIDVGMAGSAQPLGWLIDHYGFPTMLICSAAFCAVTVLVYGILTRHAADFDLDQSGDFPPAEARIPTEDRCLVETNSSLPRDEICQPVATCKHS